MATNESLRSEIDSLKERLRGLRDHAQVQRRLAEMEASDAWTRLQGQVDRTMEQLDEAGQAVETASEDARERGQLALLEAKERADEIGQRFDELGARAGEAGTSMRAQVDLAQLRAHLARMEAQDYLGEKRSELEALARSTTEDARRRIADGLAHVNRRIERLIGG
jgi:hypothetical protein